MGKRVVLAAVIAGLSGILSGATRASGLLFAQEPLGDFYYFERSDPVTGADRSSLTTLADESFAGGTGGLTVRCAEDGRELILTASFLGRDMSAPVRYAFGDEEPREASWTLRSTGMAAVAPRDVSEDFLAKAVDRTTVVFRVSDFQYRVHAYTFHLGGLDSALARLSCR